jgi:hypothetical protein
MTRVIEGQAIDRGIEIVIAIIFNEVVRLSAIAMHYAYVLYYQEDSELTVKKPWRDRGGGMMQTRRQKSHRPINYAKICD